MADVCTDLGSAVDFTYKLPFSFTGKVEKMETMCCAYRCSRSLSPCVYLVGSSTFNPWVEGSNPSALTREKHLETPPFLWKTGAIVARRSVVVTLSFPASSRPLWSEKAPRAL